MALLQNKSNITRS